MQTRSQATGLFHLQLYDSCNRCWVHFWSKLVQLVLLKGLETTSAFLASKAFTPPMALYVGKRESMATVKAFLLAFDNTVGLKINSSKSLIICINMGHDEVDHLSTIMNCKYGNLPAPYRGHPYASCDTKISKQCWIPFIEKVGARLVS